MKTADERETMNQEASAGVFDVVMFHNISISTGKETSSIAHSIVEYSAGNVDPNEMLRRLQKLGLKHTVHKEPVSINCAQSSAIAYALDAPRRHGVDLFEKRCGAVIALDTGIGKTLAAICVIRTVLCCASERRRNSQTSRMCAKSTGTHACALVVCPNDQIAVGWIAEIGRFFGTTFTVTYIEKANKNVSMWRNGILILKQRSHTSTFEEFCQESDIVIVTCSVMRSALRHVEFSQQSTVAWILSTHWDTVVFDESHHLKMPMSTIISRASMKIQYSGLKILLTATPIINRVYDADIQVMHCACDECFRCSSSSTVGRLTDHILRITIDDMATKDKEGHGANDDMRKAAASLACLTAKTQRLFFETISKTKEGNEFSITRASNSAESELEDNDDIDECLDGKEIPNITSSNWSVYSVAHGGVPMAMGRRVDVTMDTEVDRIIYRAIDRCLFTAIMERSSKKDTNVNELADEGAIDQSMQKSHTEPSSTSDVTVAGSVLTAITALRMASETRSIGATVKSNLTAKEIALCDANTTPHPKYVWVEEYIKLMHAREKVVICCYFESTATALSVHLARAGIGSVCITGCTSQQNRTDIIAKFCASETIRTLIMTSVCTEGINIQSAANHVIIMSPWWHSVRDHQVIGRVHRQGQTKEVKITWLLAKPTTAAALWAVEAHMLAVCTRKLQRGAALNQLSQKYLECRETTIRENLHANEQHGEEATLCGFTTSVRRAVVAQPRNAMPPALTSDHHQLRQKILDRAQQKEYHPEAMSNETVSQPVTAFSNIIPPTPSCEPMEIPETPPFDCAFVPPTPPSSPLCTSQTNEDVYPRCISSHRVPATPQYFLPVPMRYAPTTQMYRHPFGISKAPIGCGFWRIENAQAPVHFVCGTPNQVFTNGDALTMKVLPTAPTRQ